MWNRLRTVTGALSGACALAVCGCAPDAMETPRQQQAPREAGAVARVPTLPPQRALGALQGRRLAQGAQARTDLGEVVEARWAPEAPACVSDEAFFAERAWPEALGSVCATCHTATGMARDSRLVFEGESAPNAMAINREIFEEIAWLDRAGTPLALLKPTGGANHGGGAVIAEGDSTWTVLEEAIGRVRQPTVCVAPPPDADDPLTDGVILADAEGTLRRAALQLAMRMPTEAEVAAVQARGMGALEGIMDRMMWEEGFYERVTTLFNDRLLTDKYLGGREAVNLLEANHWPNARWYTYEDAAERANGDVEFLDNAELLTNNSVARAPLDLIAWVLRHDLPFTEIVTADYAVLNPYSAFVYGVTDFERWDDHLDPHERQAVQIPGVPHAGVLTDPMFLNRYPTTETNRNRHRARIVYRYFLGLDLLTLSDRPLDPSSPVHNPTLNDPSCTVCHTIMDPVAGAFQNWNARGSYAPVDAWYGDMLAPGMGEWLVPYEAQPASLQWLGQQIAESPDFDWATAAFMLEQLTGHPIYSRPDVDDPNYDVALAAWRAQSAFLSRLAQEFRLNGHDLRLLIKSIVRSPWFRAVDVEAWVGDAPRAIFGDPRPLTPELLNARIKAVTGYPWRPNARSKDYLLDPDFYPVLYGGIDSDDVTERLTKLNGIMANIQQRMANAMPCASVARDFSLPAGDRLLFPHVEVYGDPADTPETAPDRIRDNMVHLFDRVLDERLPPDDPQIDRAVALFEDVWSIGQQLRADGQAERDLLWRCRATNDYYTQVYLGDDRRIYRDDDYLIRSWMAVLTYLLSDYRFTHH